MDWSNDNCPVCNNPAREALPRMGDFAEIICDECGRFRITGSALQTIRHKQPEARYDALRIAKERGKKDGSMPVINSYDLPLDLA